MSDAWKTAANLGNILLRRGSLTQIQLTAAVKKQEEALARKEQQLLGQVCVSLGYLSKEELEAALEEQTHLLAPAANECAVDDALEKLDRAVNKASQSSTRLVQAAENYEAYSYMKARG